MEQIDITKMDLKELKSLAYDTMGVIELQQRNLQAINQEIAKKSQEAKEVKSVDPKK